MEELQCHHCLKMVLLKLWSADQCQYGSHWLRVCGVASLTSCFQHFLRLAVGLRHVGSLMRSYRTMGKEVGKVR